MSSPLPASSLGTVKLACRMMIVERLGGFLRAWVWYLVFTGLFTGLVASTIGLDRLRGPDFWKDPTALAAFGALMLISAITGVLGSTAWLRAVAKPGEGLRIQWKRAEWVFLGRLVQLVFVSAIVLVVVSFILTLIVAFGFGESLESVTAGQPLAGALIMGLIGTAIFVGPTALCAAWYSLSLPAAACGAPSGLLYARDRSTGHGWRLFWAFAIAITIPVLAIALAESMLAGTSGRIVPSIVIWLFQFFAYVTCLTIASLYFRELIVPQIHQSASDGSS